jgi:hypothetical protein
MNAYELMREVRPGVFRKTGVFACGKCNRLTLGADVRYGGELRNTQAAAEACCKPPICKHCEKPVLAPTSSHTLTHEQCDRNEMERHRMERLERAQLVSYVDPEMLYVEGCSRNDGFFESMAELMDHFHDQDEEERPEFAYLCTVSNESLDVGTIIENLCSDGYEDMADMMDTAELKAAVDAFNVKNANALKVYHGDYKRKVRVPWGETPSDSKADDDE